MKTILAMGIQSIGEEEVLITAMVQGNQRILTSHQPRGNYEIFRGIRIDMGEEYKFPSLPDTASPGEKAELVKGQVALVTEQQRAKLGKESADLAHKRAKELAQKAHQNAVELHEKLVAAEKENAKLTADFELAKLQKQAKIDEKKALEADDRARRSALVANDLETVLSVHNAYLEVAKAQIERSINRADFVQKVAAAIGTAYTAILALSFGPTATTTGTELALPVAGIAPTIFLGLAFATSAAYVAWLRDRIPVDVVPPSGTFRGDQDARRLTFIRWTNASVDRNKYLLQVAVINLGIGIFYLPYAYIKIDDWPKYWTWVVVLAVSSLILPLVIGWLDRRLNSDDHSGPDNGPVTVTKK